MKKLILFILAAALIALPACSVQENTSPELFIERLKKNNENLIFESDSAFWEDNAWFCFAEDNNGTKFSFEIQTDENGNAKKISLACIQTDKAEEFFSAVKSIIKTYAPEDDAEQAAQALIAEKSGFSYFETQWHRYAFAKSESELYFSAESAKLVPQSDVPLSLKPNDISPE